MTYTNYVYYINPYGKKIKMTFTYHVHSPTSALQQVDMKQEKV